MRSFWYLLLFLWMPAVVSAQKTRSFIPDTTVSGFVLCDSSSAIALFGRIRASELIELGPPEGLPHVHFKNTEGSEVLSLYLHPGTYENQYPEVRISRTVSCPIRGTLPIAHFTTSRRIRLGMTEQEVKAIFGKEEKHGTAASGTTLHYSLTEQEAPSFLERSGYPSYYAHFVFASGSLVEYRFGFDYP